MSGRKRSRPGRSALASGLLLGREKAAPVSGPAMGFAIGPPASPPPSKRRSAGLITYRSDGHLITFAPTGTGKTVGPVICNALTHPGQLIVVDVKGEVCAATARRRREMGQAVHVLDLRDGAKADSLNPLDLALKTGTDTVAIARTLAAELVARSGHERDPFWPNWAETLLCAGITWLMDDLPPEESNLGRLYRMFSEDDVDFRIATLIDHKLIKSRSAMSAFQSYMNLPDRDTRPSVLASALAPIRLFDSDLVRDVTSTTTIDLEALIAGAPMTIYIVVPPFRLVAYAPLLRLWITGLLAALTQRTVPPPQRTLFLCDEAGNLGRMEAFLTASTLMRGWGLTLWSFWQNPAQLEIYGAQARTILDNAGVVQLFGARNRRMAAEFTALVGGVDPDEILTMGKDEQLLLIEGGRPRLARRMRYFEESMFAGLYDQPTLSQGKPLAR